MAEVLIGSARNGDHGNGWSGKNVPGDQSGEEVSTQKFYNHVKGWVVLRAKDKEVAHKICACMLAACSNNNIGYDQSKRDTLLNECRKYLYDVSKVTVPCDTDCSALVRVCVSYSLGREVPNMRTVDMKGILLNLGVFYEVTNWNKTTLEVGDILTTKTSGHTGVVVSACKENIASEPVKFSSITYKKGDKGDGVKVIQSILRINVDGDFGRETDTAVRLFQAKNMLDVDGEVGPMTWSFLKNSV